MEELRKKKMRTGRERRVRITTFQKGDVVITKEHITYRVNRHITHGEEKVWSTQTNWSERSFRQATR